MKNSQKAIGNRQPATVQTRKELYRDSFGILVLIGLLLSPEIGSTQTREKIRVALGSISVNSSVIPIGAQHGLFAKHGVDLEPIYFGGGMNSIAALTSNSVQLLAAGSTATVGARVGGIDITMLAMQSSKLDYSVLVAPDVKMPQDLKGKIVTGTRTGASADTALRLYLQKHGLVPDKDVIFISVADSQQGRSMLWCVVSSPGRYCRRLTARWPNSRGSVSSPICAKPTSNIQGRLLPASAPTSRLTPLRWKVF